jgi:hypothetical protein
VIFAFIFRQKKGFESLLFYTCIVVAFSPAIANQYLAIAVPFVSVYLNPYTVSYSLVGTLFLLLDGNGMHITAGQNTNYYTYPGFYPLLVILLFLGLIRNLWYQQVLEFINKVWSEIKIQFE